MSSQIAHMPRAASPDTIWTMKTRPFSCSACHETIASDAPPGALVRCPLCGEAVRVPIDAARKHAVDVNQTIDPANRKATTAMLWGIVGLACCPVVGLVGLILGLRVPNGEGEDETEARLIRRRKTIAIICGALSLVVYTIAGIVAIPMIRGGISSIAVETREVQCESYIKEIAAALSEYADRESAFPPTLQTLADQKYISADRLYRVIDGVEHRFRYIPGFDPYISVGSVIVFDYDGAHRDGGGHVILGDLTVHYVRKAKFKQAIENIMLPDGTLYDPYE